ncbi:MAG TPA: hypothetical protein VMJ30_09625 [Gemmatimonadales bacterium]|nr:hypothetical protein [Gemmatimonadales bacterium]
MFRRFWPAVPCLLLTLAACSEHDTPLVPPDPAVAIAPPAIGKARLPQMERLAKRFALALHDPEFRRYVYRRLNGSPYREHKLPFRRFLGEEGGAGMRAFTAGRPEVEDSVGKEAEGASALEFYFPVPAHRRSWSGDENILVATAWADRDAPVAFDPRGQRSILSPDRPPDTPVLALVPVEQDFDSPAALARPEATQCVEPCVPTSGGTDGTSGGTGNPGGPQVAPPPAGIYLLKSHFTSTFEGWLKGDPEFEFHILGQTGTTDSLTDYQCAGEKQPAPYYFDQNGTDWSGRVMLFNALQLSNYKASHPNQAFRIFAVEDDNEACVIRTDQGNFWGTISAASTLYKDATGVIDTFNIGKILIMKTDLKKFWTLVSNLILTNDELPGTAIKDSTVKEFHGGYNFVIKGKDNATNGWLQLEVR